jgi:hypothetical protein
VALAVGIAKRPAVTMHSLFGAASIYLLIGVFFAFVYDAVGILGADSFFTQTANADRADYVYFSFCTLTTVGYGDFTPAGGVGRTLAITEAVLGQLYLVVVITLIVSAIAARRSARYGS